MRKERSWRRSAVFAVCFVLGTGVAMRLSWAQLRWCVEWFEIPELVEWRERLPVGCEVVDCCPGCPGPLEELAWRIRFEAPAGLSASLRFSGLPGSPAEVLKIEGAGQWSADQSLTIAKGDTTLRGFKLAAGRAPPVASLSWQLADAQRSAKGDKKGSAADLMGPGADSPKVSIEIEQRLGRFVVGRWKRGLILVRCPGPIVGRADRVRVDNNDSGDQTVILLDGKRGTSCVNDEVHRTATTVAVGNLVAKGACPGEAIVFSDDDAMQLRENLSTWTNASGDLLPVNLTPNLINAPMNFWVMRGGFAATNTRVTNDLARANQLYNVMNCGTRFTAASVRDATADTDTAGLLNADCGSAALLRSRIGFVTGTLNVYYLNDPGARGWWCGNNTIIIGSGADNESLAHEIGHAFSLDHTNTVAGMSATNLMITGGTGRNNITEAQCFRSNVNTTSTLNTNANRTGPTRTCPDGMTSAACPTLSLDVAPN